MFKIPEIDKELLYLYDHYCNVKGQEPLTFCEVDAWQRVTGSELSPEEVGILFELDGAYYETRNKVD